MLIIVVERLMEEGHKIEINLNVEAIEFIAPHVKKEFKDTCVVVLRSGVVMHLNLKQQELVGMMLRYK